MKTGDIATVRSYLRKSLGPEQPENEALDRIDQCLASYKRPPCECHGSWPLHADDQAAALREAHLENDHLKGADKRHNAETSVIHDDLLELARLFDVHYDGMSSPAAFLHVDIVPAVKRILEEMREIVSELEREPEDSEVLKYEPDHEPSWADWIAWLDRHYPEDVFVGGPDSDRGPRAIAAFRRALRDEDR